MVIIKTKNHICSYLKGANQLRICAVKIEMLLAEQGITKAILSERCGISRQNISTIVRRGTCEPKTAGKLAAGLGVSVEELLERSA